MLHAGGVSTKEIDAFSAPLQFDLDASRIPILEQGTQIVADTFRLCAEVINECVISHCSLQIR